MTTVYKTWIIDELTSWAETFNNNYPNSMEETIDEEEKSYNLIHAAIDKLSKNECSKEDYENILFHLWQSKSEELKQKKPDSNLMKSGF